MARSRQVAPDTWSGSRGFVLAAISSAVGIGSIWKFPYEVGANGGGAFVAVYAVGLVAVVVPLLLVEFAIGRSGKGDAATSLGLVAAAARRSRRWRAIGALGAVTAFLILSFYAVIGGWTVAFAWRSATDDLPSDPSAAQRRFDDFLAQPWVMAACAAGFLCVVALVVARGIGRGIERAATVLMPVLVVLLSALAGYSSLEGDVAAAARFLFVPDLDALSGRAVLEALGLGFFSIGVGLGLMITYAAASPATVNLRRAAVVSVIADSAISLIAGMAVFPVVFARGLDPAGGPGLVFVTLPLAFSGVPGGRIAAVAFFVLLVVAALGSAIAMLEGVVAVAGGTLQRHRPAGQSTRTAVVAASAVACFLVGLLTVWSFNRLASWHPLGALGRFRSSTAFDLIDELTSNLLLPAGGLALAMLAGWRLRSAFVADELGPARLDRVVVVLLRWVVPVVVIAAVVASCSA